LTDAEKVEMSGLLEIPAFRSLVYRLMISTGVFAVQTNGADGRDLNFSEGRRSVALELLNDLEASQPVAHREPVPILTLIQTFREVAQTAPIKGVKRDRDQYRDLDD
jgi:hypothetical protein